jgi:hypothetical protein
MASNFSKKQSLDYVKIAASYHEAAHAFFAVYNCMKVLEINISNLDYGYVHYLPYDIDYIDLLDKLIIFELQMLYSGLISEKIYYNDICGSNIFPAHLYGAYSDTKAASLLIKKYKFLFPNKSVALIKKHNKKYIKTLLQEHWSIIKLIAHNIYKKEKLSEDDLKFILLNKTNNRKFWRGRYKAIELIYSDDKISKEELEIIINNIQ